MGRVTVQIRDRRTGDAHDIAVLHTLGWQRGLAGVLAAAYLDGLSVSDSERRWLAKEADPDPATHDLVAEVDGRVVGLAAFGRSYDPDLPGRGTVDIAELSLLYVHPGHWGTGVAGRLHDSVVQALTAEGYAAGRLWMVVGNRRAHAFYLHRGWVFDRMQRQETDRGTTWTEQRYRLDLPG